MKKEAHQIIHQEIKTLERISEIFRKYFAKKNGVDLKIPHRKAHEPLDLDE